MTRYLSPGGFDLLKVDVDPGNVLAREFSELELKNLPYATLQAANATAFAVRERWASAMPRVFDRPTALTLKAPLIQKATKDKPAATIFIRDEAFKGTPPAKYLLAEAYGGIRRHKAFEKRLIEKGILPSNQYAVPGRGAALDAFGNLGGGLLNQLLSQLQARFDPAQNESEASRKRRHRRAEKRGERAGDFFAITARSGSHLPSGVYQRIGTGFGGAIRSVLAFVRPPSYQVRYDVFGLAQGIYTAQFPFHFERELAKAVATSKYRGRA